MVSNKMHETKWSKQMHRTKICYVDDDDDETDMRAILQDGESMHVPMRMMDAMSRDITTHIGCITDGSGDVLGLHRPGPRINDAQRRDLAAYKAYDAHTSNAWKAPPTGAGSGEFRGQREGDQCTVNGSPGHLKMIGDKLHCVPDARKKDALAMLDERETAYRAYNDEISQCWRGADR
jgi:hypothetical protein